MEQISGYNRCIRLRLAFITCVNVKALVRKPESIMNSKEYKLSFCTVIHRDDDIAIIEIDEGVNVDAEMSDEITGLAANVLGDKLIGLLSNRKNSYSLSFDAMEAMAKLPNMIALAIVIYTEKSRLLIETQNFFISHMKKKPVKIFTDMDEAENWLHEELSKVAN